MGPERLFLSPPCVDREEEEAAAAAVRSGWVAPVGPDLVAFESEFAASLGSGLHTVALSSGTAGLHLSLLIAGVRPGDAVAVSTFSFVASANAIRYCGAEPVFVDSDPETWNMDPECLKRALNACRRRHKKVSAVVFVDLFGSCAGAPAIARICAEENVPMIEDAAEAAGAVLENQPAGTFGNFSIFSFNGNKIITTGGGGLFVSKDRESADRVRHLSTQAREPFLHYEHKEIGYNYRMSNLLAAVGRVQLRKLDSFIERRARIRKIYRDSLAPYGEITLNPLAGENTGTNHWLTVAILPSAAFAARVIQAAERANIEVRPVWKPLHLQPAFGGTKAFLNGVSEAAFATAVCLPSGSRMSIGDCQRVANLFAGNESNPDR